MKRDSKIYVAGHRGLAGSALARALQAKGYRQIVTRTRAELDLTDQAAVRQFFQRERPEFVFLAAAKVGGIHANSTYPAEFIYQNLTIGSNVIHAAYEHGVSKLMFLGSSCVYPKHAAQPIKEEYLLTGPLEPTNEPYAVAKIAGIKMCAAYNRQYGTDFVSVMPTNLYGLGDSYDPLNAHVLPALLRKMHEAKLKQQPAVTVWGTGIPRREFLHADDFADACIFLMEKRTSETGEMINIGAGTDISIREVAELIAAAVGFHGELEFDPSKPDGALRKLLDISRLRALGWQAKIGLRDGIQMTYADYAARAAQRE